MNKKRIVSVALAVCLLAIAAVGSLAYFTDKTETKENTFTVGNVKIELTEPGWDESGKNDAVNAYPGQALKKDPTVKNVGANPCFVRVKVTGLDCLGEQGMITYETGNTTGALGENWVKDGDYFYYTKVLEPNASTVALFEQIRIPVTVVNGVADTEYSVEVFAEAVQAQGARADWADVQAMTAQELIDWFATCGL